MPRADKNIFPKFTTMRHAWAVVQKDEPNRILEIHMYKSDAQKRLKENPEWWEIEPNTILVERWKYQP
jgi:hypothetical protein